MTDYRPVLIALLAFGACVPGAPRAADEAATARENMYLSGTEVRPPAPVSGDLVAAAGRITTDHDVRGDAVLAAGSIEIRGGVGEDLRVAGGILHLGGRVAGDALIAAANITVGREARVAGETLIAAHDAAVGGRFGRKLTVYARHILFSARAEGDVRLVGETIELLPGAQVQGRLTYKSGSEIRVHPGAQAGALVREPGAFPRFELPGALLFRPMLILGLLAAGTVLLVLFPRFTASALQTLGAAPLKSLGLGTAIFFSVPPVVLLLVITIIGIPIALAGAALYALALLAGYLVAAAFLGRALLRAARRDPAGRGWSVLALAVALVVLWLAGNVPYAGPLLIGLVVILGLGAMALQAFSHYSRT